jgi:hypothetical protein
MFIPGLKYFEHLPVPNGHESPILAAPDCRWCGAPRLKRAPLLWRLWVWISYGFRRPFAFSCKARGCELYSASRRRWFVGFRGCGWDRS